VRYVLMIAGGEPGAADALQESELPECVEWSEEMRQRGVLRGGAGLRPPSDATTVRVRNGAVLLTDGPFAETKEQLAGFNLIQCADLDEAIEIASRHPAAGTGMIEIRPVWET
jgi:hypothetical protein